MIDPSRGMPQHIALRSPRDHPWISGRGKIGRARAEQEAGIEGYPGPSAASALDFEERLCPIELRHFAQGLSARFSRSVWRRSAASRRASSGVGMRPSQIITAASATASFLLLASPRIEPSQSSMHQCRRFCDHSTDAQSSRSRKRGR
jgi:hypothetical protein